jgi:putative transposase
MLKPTARRYQMKGKRFSNEQIINILKEADAGIKPGELCRKYGISEATYYNWKAKYGNMTVSDARKLKELEQENGRLKKLVANQALDIQMLKEVCSKNF